MKSVLSLLFVVAASAYWPAYDQEQPVPARSAPNVFPDPAKGYAIVEVGEGFYILNEGQYFSAVIHKNGQLLVVDAPVGNWGESNYVQAIDEVAAMTGGTVTHMLYSHYHYDHVGNAFKVKAAYPNITIVAHAATTDQCLRDSDPRRPIPDASFKSTYEFKAFGIVIEPIEVHCPGNIAIFSERARVVMHIDVVFPRWSPFQALAYAESPFRYLANDAHDRLLAYDFDTFVPGHVGTLGTREDIIEAKELNGDILASAQYAIANTDFSSAAATGAFTPGNANFGNQWLGFSAYLNTLSATCDEYLQALQNSDGETWSQRLGGMQAMGSSHCTQAITVLRIDGDPRTPSVELPEGHVNLDDDDDGDDDGSDDDDDDSDDQDDDQDQGKKRGRAASTKSTYGIAAAGGVMGLAGLLVWVRRRQGVTPMADQEDEEQGAGMPQLETAA